MAKTKTCADKHCPTHGALLPRGRSFRGTVTSAFQKTAKVTWAHLHKVKKYERYETKRSKVKAHVPDCMAIKPGDNVKIMECRPISKTKNFVIIEKTGAGEVPSEKPRPEPIHAEAKEKQERSE